MIEAFDAIIATALSVGNTIYFVLRAEKRTYEARIRAATSEAAYSASERRYEFVEREFNTQRGTWADRETMLLDRIDSLMDRAISPPQEVYADRHAAEPDAEENVRTIVDIDVAQANRRMQEGRIAIGAKEIQDQYKSMNLAITEEEARLQAEAMLEGRSPVED